MLTGTVGTCADTSFIHIMKKIGFDHLFIELFNVYVRLICSPAPSGHVCTLSGSSWPASVPHLGQVRKGSAMLWLLMQ